MLKNRKPRRMFCLVGVTVVCMFGVVFIMLLFVSLCVPSLFADGSDLFLCPPPPAKKKGTQTRQHQHSHKIKIIEQVKKTNGKHIKINEQNTNILERSTKND